MAALLSASTKPGNVLAAIMPGGGTRPMREPVGNSGSAAYAGKTKSAKRGGGRGPSEEPVGNSGSAAYAGKTKSAKRRVAASAAAAMMRSAFFLLMLFFLWCGDPRATHLFRDR